MKYILGFFYLCISLIFLIRLSIAIYTIFSYKKILKLNPEITLKMVINGIIEHSLGLIGVQLLYWI